MKGTIGIVASERNNFSWYSIQSLLNLKQYMGDRVSITHVHSGTIPDGRNAVLEIAKKSLHDYAIMVDSDMTFPKDGIVRLLDSMAKFDATIACGSYFGTYPPYSSTPMAFDELEGKQIALTSWNDTRYITSCGMGFTLIKRELFEIKFEFRPNLGEDHLFCNEARKRGHKIILDPSVKCGHLRMIPIDEAIARKIYE